MYELVFRRFGKSSFSAFAVLSVLMLASSVFAQTTGNLQGVVRDPNGAVVAGATVKVTNTETGIVRETTTNDDGLYRVVNLIPGGAYKIEIAATGFNERIVENVAVRLATENSADVELGVQGASGEVTVTGEAPLINSTQNQLSTSYSQRQLTQLPYNGGSIDNLALLTPGVVTPGDTDFTNGVGISANGNRGRSNNFQLDGQDNNDNSVAGPTLSITNTEAIGDYQVTTTNPSAEFGRNAGAQINTVTKSGTNDLHGALFEYFSNNRLNARNNLEKQAAASYSFLANNGFSQLRGLADRNGQNIFSLNRFGGALGGPIKKDRAFFFVTIQQDIQNGEVDDNSLGTGAVLFTPDSVRLAQSLGFPGANLILGNTNVGGGPTATNVPGTFIVVPQLDDKNGDGVPDSFLLPNGAFTNSVFVCRVAVTSGACPVGQRVALQTGEAIRIVPNRFRDFQLITKENFNITDKDTLDITYIYDNTKFPDSPATGTLISGAFFDVPSKNNKLAATYTRLINSTFTNEARFNFSRLDVRFGDPEGTLPGPGITFTGQRDRAVTFNAIGQPISSANFFSQSFGTANTLPQSRKVDVYQEQDTFSASLGNHFVKVGADIRQQKVNNFFLPNFLGVYRFAPVGEANSGTGLCTLCRFFNFNFNPLTGANATATAFENLLLGRPDRVTFALGNPNIKTTQNDYFFFVQDDWRARSNLTLNLGLRYEYSTTPFNPIIEDINEREANPSTAIFSSAFPIETRTAQKLKTDKNNFAPRVGFAYSPNINFLGDRFSNGRTVIRAGFGIAYDPSFFNIVLNTVTAAPFAAAGAFPQIPSATSQPFPFLPTTTAQLNLTPGTNGGDPRLFNQTRVDPNFYSPYTMGYSVGIQQELFKDSVLEVRYVGSRIVGQYQTVNGNPNVRFLNNAAQCLGLSFGAFTNGIVVGSPAASIESSCLGGGFQNRPAIPTSDPNNPITFSSNGRVDPNFGPVRLRTNGATASYNSLQTRFDTRFNDIVFNANYTFSKTIDNASEIFSTFGGGQTIADPQNPFDSTNGERGLSAFHQKHNFTTNFVYELPFYRDQQGFIGKALGGFQFSGIVRIGSGRPYTPQNILANSDPGFDTAFFSGAGSLRPYNGNPNAPVGTIAFGVGAACLLFADPLCGDPTLPPGQGGPPLPGQFIIYNTQIPGSSGRLVTTAQALQEARLFYNDFGLYQFGLPLRQTAGADQAFAEAFSLFRTPYGIGRNTFFGETFKTVNIGVFKTTNISESIRVEVRAEATNLFNRRNFGVPDPFTEDAYGSVAVSSFQNAGFNAGSAREIRFGVRFLF